MSTAPAENSYERVLSLWFGNLDAAGCADAAHTQLWWRKDPQFDALLRQEFLSEHQAVQSGQRQAWLQEPRSRLAYIVVLDQFSRNMFRDTPAMFGSDALALAAALTGIDAAHDRACALAERIFYYLPLMHSEDLAVQNRCVALFSAFCEELQPPQAKDIANNLNYAIRHRDVIQRFGRFPHRNSILGRASTPEEIEFLKQPGSSF